MKGLLSLAARQTAGYLWLNLRIHFAARAYWNRGACVE
ncbi:hypothetical protein SAMN05518684_1238 [Salipaludibacillus aurantiacus]|uniref:Uncharacterized protein n=1 Tax=Salipaludibacillus aurantiacus TaxID=1601833 RepID=A0A1H9X1Y4_9BACI|nr:hypothetical protein SAMN05518684_1238 [Salipaludibacillus aurantiacus]